uniref:ABC transporter domain-containing protein n=1 Tax=Panagrolaimus sp. JU765 TaxID=591449 RepID=A0AC34QV07_9BILA
MIAMAEPAGLARWETLDAIQLDVFQVSMKKVLVSFAVDTAIYLFLAWYISALFPGTYGIPKKWNFFMTKSYWVHSSAVTETDSRATSTPPANSDDFEVEPNLPLAVEIVDMVKVYNNNTKALDKLSVRFYESQITGFLGHNGAGKTTTISILSGLYTPSKGTAYIYDKDIRTEMSSIRESLGVCPQYNVLFDLMTVEEQLWFYGSLKGVSSDDIDSEVENILMDIDLVKKRTALSILSGLYTPSKGTAYIYDKDIRTEMSSIRESLGVCPQYNVLFDLMTVEEQLWFYGSLKGVSSDDIDSEVENILMDIDLMKKRAALSSDLSGGMKRKLCIGIALIGGSKLVILDEPTAGIDAHARRSIWQLLLKHKRGRTMILSTHHMDEADVLADRIAIIAEGQLRTAGSALFLKKRFGNGYTLTLARSTNRMSVLPPPYVENPGETLPRKPLDELMEKMTKNRSKFVDDMGTEVVYNLPLDMSAEEMKRLFEELDMKKYDLGIDSYGISAPTLQQIFIRVAPMHELKLKKEQMKTCLGIIKNLWRKLTKKNVQVSNENLTEHLVNNMPEDHSHPPVVTVETKRALLKLHTKALLAKRWHNTRRILLVLFAELYAKFQQRAGTISYSYDVSQQPLYLTPIIYGNYTEVYFGVWNQKHATVSYLKSMMESPGIGCRCMTNIDLYNDTMDRCLDDYGEGHMNLAGDVASKIPYNVEQKCGCTPNGGWNCTYGDYPIESLQSFTLNTSDRVWDVTFRNISQFRLVNSKNTTRHVNVTLGGWTVGHTNVQSMTEFEMGYAGDGLDTLLASLDSAASVWSLDWENATDGVNWTTSSNPFNPEYGNPKDFFNDTLPSLETEENAKIWFNNKAYAALPINTNSYHNGILRALSSPYKDPEEVGIMTISHPMNKTVEDAVGFSDQLQKTMMFRVVVSVLVLSFIPASACLLLVEERTSFSRHLQSVFGVSPWLYWLTNFIYDYMILNICCLLIVLIYVAMGVEVFTYSLDASYSTFLIFVIYNASVLPCIYVFQMIFTIPSVAYAIIGIGLFFIGVVTSMVILLLENLVSSDDTLVVAHQICSIVFLIVPQYNLGVAISRLNFIYGVYITAEQYLKSIGRRDMLGQVPLPLVSRWDLMGQHFFALIVDGLIFLIILGIIEYKHVIFKFLRRREQRTTRKLLEKYHKDRKLLDEDVQREQTFVENIKNYDDYGLVVKGLSKGYSGEFLAVENLSFAVEKGECFGLLGVNGAGKTSTFSMLTGRLIIGSGDAYIHGNSVVDGGFNSFRLLGYCPQFDALNLRLTAREQLTFYARIRGIREMDIEHIVDWAINQMQLLPYANEVSGSYSGGNKRKLSAAIALVADPPVVLLDEPSAGMDVSSQQFMWNLILQLRRAKRTVIITSHSMEECEALCTRTAIMVHGQFQCIGSIQHLKEKFGQGYTLTIKVVHKEDIERVKEFVRKNIAGSFLQSIHCNTLFYRIRGIHCSLSLAFGAINELQKLLPIEDYQLSQTTLDDVFVSFAAKSENDPADLGDVTFDEIHSPPPDRTQESTDLTDPPNH